MTGTGAAPALENASPNRPAAVATGDGAIATASACAPPAGLAAASSASKSVKSLAGCSLGPVSPYSSVVMKWQEAEERVKMASHRAQAAEHRALAASRELERMKLATEAHQTAATADRRLAELVVALAVGCAAILALAGGRMGFA